MTTATDLAAAINVDTACARDFIQARAWTAPGKERVYLTQATGPALKRWNDVGYLEVATGKLVGVPARIANRVEPLLPAPTEAPAAPAPSVAHDPAFHAAARQGEAALHGSEADLLEAVNAGHVSVSDAMNQDF